jgi:hypothetical protein
MFFKEINVGEKFETIQKGYQHQFIKIEESITQYEKIKYNARRLDNNNRCSIPDNIIVKKLED